MNINKQALSEVYDIIYHMEKELYNKIPRQFLYFIKENKDNNYVVTIDYSKSINEQELLQQTRIILSLLYRDYLCPEEERLALIEKDKKELEEIENEIKDAYNPDNMFKNKKILENYNNNLPIEVKRKSFFDKIIEFIKNIIKKRVT